MGALIAFEERINAIPVADGRPVTWFLDIDGVMNLIGPRPRGSGSGDVWPSYLYTTVVNFQRAWPITYAPSLIHLLNLLAERGVVSFRWLTTWEHDGPAKFAPAVGLQIGDWVAGEDVDDDPSWWKLRVVNAHMADDDALFIWTDDDIGYYLEARQVTDMLPPGRALIVCPDERKGLTPDNFDAILTTIETEFRQ